MIVNEVFLSLFEALFTIPKKTRNKLALANAVHFFLGQLLLGRLSLSVFYDGNFFEPFGSANGNARGSNSFGSVDVVGMNLCGLVVEYVLHLYSLKKIVDE
jgi:hypothetical protein